MKKYIIIIGLLTWSAVSPVQVNAQVPIVDIIKEGIIKVIRAADLRIQRLQNETVWLQNAQKVLENKMSELKLGEITDWVAKQKALYANYFDELWKVKLTIDNYRAAKAIMEKQLLLVQEYKRVFNLAKHDHNFTGKELQYMEQVYSGILNKSLRNLDLVEMVVTAFTTQMSDAKRLELLQQAEAKMDEHLADLRQFSQQNILVSLQRTKDANDVNVVKKLYGL